MSKLDSETRWPSPVEHQALPDDWAQRQQNWDPPYREDVQLPGQPWEPPFREEPDPAPPTNDEPAREEDS
jgi:hypothetical protein